MQANMVKRVDVVTNRKARYEYHILDTYEAGIKLQGLEVKALRNKLVSISEAWIKVDSKKNEAWLVGATINPPNIPDWQKYNPAQNRLLLLRKSELRKLRAETIKGVTIVPLTIYFNERNFAKVTIATVKGKKMFDKRKQIKERDIRRRGY